MGKELTEQEIFEEASRGYKLCSCGSGEQSYWLRDGYGIELCKVCDKCEKEKLSHYRSDIMERYDCDEPIEEDE